MEEKKLLIDCIDFIPQKDVLFEETIKDSSRRLIVKGILQRANIKNQNGRVYPRDILVRESKKYEENFIKNRMATGELDHPESSIINLKNVSHNIVEIHWDGDNLIGTLEVLPTPNGNILRELFKSNIRVGISSRGLGTIKKDVNENADFVQDDFELLCFDVVSSPSTVGSFLFPATNLNENINKITLITNKWDSVENIIRDILLEIG